MLKNKLQYFALIILSVLQCEAFAAFEIFEEDSEGYYGSAQTRPFKEAVENDDPLTARDIAFLESVQITRITERWYGRVMVGKAKVNVSSFENNSSSFLDTFFLSTSSISDNVYQLLVAGGKVWEQWAFEIEFLFSKKLSFFMDPVLVGTSSVIGPYVTNANVQLYQYMATANAQYIIPRMFSFYPRRLQIHLDAGVGAALLNSTVDGATTDPDTTPAYQSTSWQSYPVVGMLGVGARYQISPHFLSGVTYRYYGSGRSKYGPVQSIKWEANKLTTSGFYIDVTYQY